MCLKLKLNECSEKYISTKYISTSQLVIFIKNISSKYFDKILITCIVLTEFKKELMIFNNL